MKQLQFDYRATCGVALDALRARAQSLASIIEKVRNAFGAGYDTDYASINLPADTTLVAPVQEVVNQQQQRKPTMLVVIGIGGSNLGTLAVHQALNGLRYNDRNTKLRCYFVDTVDTRQTTEVLQIAEQELKQGNNIVVNVVTKSGSTAETIANFHLFVELLKKYNKNNYAESVVITSNKDSALWLVGQQEGIVCLAIPEKVGGRYSVFSAVGLFPLALLGVDIKELLAGAQRMIERCTSTNIEDNVAALSAALIYEQSQQKKNILDHFVFGVDLEGIGRWYRQLMGESIGKKETVNVSPTVSVGSTDLHSVGQLYLGGPRDKMTMFVAVEKQVHDLKVPQLPAYKNLVEHLQGKTLAGIMQAILHGVQQAYQKNKRPFATITLPEVTAHSVGQLLQYKMLEMIYLGKLFEVNPFDQPHVELYKQETRKLLAHE